MAKRINTQFLTLLTAVVGALLLLIAGALVYKHFSHRDPQKFIADGEREFVAGNYDAALVDYSRALKLRPGNPELLVRFGELLEYTVGVHRDALEGARGAWRQALVSNPANIPALQHLLDSYVEEMQIEPNPKVYPNVRDIAGKLAAADPTNQRAKAYEQIATIMQPQAGVATAPAALAAAMKDLEAQVKADPGDSELLYYLSRGKLQSAQDFAKNNDLESARAVLASLLETTNSAIKASPKSATVQWRASTIYSGLAGLDPANAPARQGQALAAITAAHANVKPADLHYNDIETAMADSLFRQRKPAEGAAILRTMHEQNPADPVARLLLARFLASQPATRQEAIDLLSKPITVQGKRGLRAALAHGYDLERLYELTLAQIANYVSTDDPARRTALLADIDASFKSFSNVAPSDTVAALRLQGMVQAIKNQNVEAVATFHRALSTLKRNGDSDPELLLQAGRVDLQAGQNGSAEKLFQQYVAGNPSAVEPRIELAAMYLQDDQFGEAKRVLDELDKLRPDSPDVAAMHIQLLTEQKNFDAAKPYYAKLPEKTTGEQRAKAQSAVHLKDDAEVIRLLELVRAKDPEDVRAALVLAQAYAGQDQKAKAAAVIADALKRSPNDPSLRVMQKRLANATPQELQALVDQLTSGTDDFSKAMKSFQLALGKEQYDEAIGHLDTANKLKPENKGVHQGYFQAYLTQRKFDKAASEIPLLSQLNADSADGLIFRTQLALAQQNYVEAVKSAHSLVERRPDFSESYVQLAQALEASGRQEEALKEYEHALDRQSNSFDALKGAAGVSLALHQSDKAGTYINRGVSLFPNSAVFRQMSLSYDLLYSAHPETAVDELTKLSAASPDDPGLALALAQAALHVSEVDKTSDPARSQQLLDTANATLKKSVAKWRDDASFPAVLADVQRQSGDLAGAEKTLTDFIEQPQQKKDVAAWRNLIEFYERTNQRDKYESALRTTIGFADKKVDLIQRLAMAQFQKGHVDDALTTLKGISDANVVKERVQFLISANRIADAEKEIKAALASTSGSSELSNMLASLYLDTRRFDEARAAAKANVIADPNDMTALYVQALVELRRPNGDLGMALRNLNTIKVHSPEDAASRLAIAEADHRTNHPEAEIQELEDLVQLKPLNRDARLHLLTAYASFTPPDWEHYDKLIASTLALPEFHNDATWYQRQAMGQSAREQYPQAAASLRAAVKLNSQSAELEFELLKTLVAAKDYPGTIKEADGLLAGDKKPWWALYCRGIARASSSDKKGGVADLDAALASANAAKDRNAAQLIVSAFATSVSPDEALQRIAAQPSDVGWRLMAAKLYAEKKDFASAVKTAEGVRDDSSTAVTPAQMQLALRMVAENSQVSKQFDTAKANYIKLIEVAPNDLLAMNNLAYMLATDMQDPQSAKPFIQRAFQMATKAGGVANISDTYGWVMTLAGGADARVGLDTLTSVVNANPDFVEARYHLGMAMLRNNQSGSAKLQFQKAIDQINAKQQTQPGYGTELKPLLSAALEKASQATGQTTLPAVK